MLSTILGGLLGGLFRILPEFLKWLDKKDERSHELAMFDKQLEADRLRSQAHIAEIEAQGAVTMDVAALDALKEAIKGQSQLTGVTWIDGLNQSVRPFVTYLLLSLYLGAKASGLVILHRAGTDVAGLFAVAYTADDAALLSGILNFWFLDRVIRKRSA